MNASPKDTSVRIQSLARGNAILGVIEKHGVATLATIARQTGLNKTTAFYLLGSLVDLGFVERLDQASLQHQYRRRTGRTFARD